MKFIDHSLFIWYTVHLSKKRGRKRKEKGESFHENHKSTLAHRAGTDSGSRRFPAGGQCPGGHSELCRMERSWHRLHRSFRERGLPKCSLFSHRFWRGKP